MIAQTQIPCYFAFHTATVLHTHQAISRSPPGMAGVDLSDDDERDQGVSETFEAAASYLASAVTSGDARFSDSTKLAFYGLYKQAAAGRCNTSKPAFWDFAGKAKW